MKKSFRKQNKKILKHDLLPAEETWANKMSPEETLIWLNQSGRFFWEAADAKTRRLYGLDWLGKL
ncbi:MAG: hypothetical protein HY747_11655 [Elusimicrobia bacterium]|nr:hypothetical protein [Elusimicrobiota bacterium]